MDFNKAFDNLIPGLGAEAIINILSSLIIIVVVAFVRYLVLRFVSKRYDDTRMIYNWRKYSGYIAFAIAALLIGRVWFEGIGTLGTFLGLLSAGIAIALKDPIVNFVGWLFIIWRRPFQVGDRVQIGSNIGDVIDLRIFQFTLMEIGNWVNADQYSGRMIYIPNQKVFTEVQANYSKGFKYVWNEVPVLVTFESNWKAAKEILEKIVFNHSEGMSDMAQEQVRKAAKEFLIVEQNFSPAVYTSVEDSGVLLTLRYPCNFRTRRDSYQIVWEEILNEFSKRDDIDFAYPTNRFYNNIKEGKPEARADQEND